jgi:hypothetical protein
MAGFSCEESIKAKKGTQRNEVARMDGPADGGHFFASLLITSLDW